MLENLERKMATIVEIKLKPTATAADLAKLMEIIAMLKFLNDDVEVPSKSNETEVVKTDKPKCKKGCTKCMITEKY